MGKIITMTSAEIREKYGYDAAKIKKMLEDAPEFDIKDIPELKGFRPGRTFRGFAAYKEYINRAGRPKSEDPKVGVSVRIPLSAAAGLRATGPGWQTRISEYLVRGIKRGDLGNISIAA